ncbi:carboxymuconolactone decarboxylase family protein [Hymenobacter setariae]|jgi:AhpD family alkylhydroperoxidase|uniref:Carboxymuconolactone decarboxylase family protein n=1 Tax=Hymenobacter setariae TaxID=2594794 RepID=A0A558BVC0_9BACT|nr:carboxymuconolactone decarboxylase family protein [Hymenobacter setariae]TVT40461.1 carboxymuconolactone decarboxylase family protein [Hymenobacter setariae]
MSQRLNLQHVAPEAYKAMFALEKYLGTTQLTPIQKHLLKVRASQLNGCAFCLDMHTREARHDGETEQRLYLLNAWRETSLFTPEEQALLALTEEITFISKGGVSEATYQQAVAVLGEQRVAQAIMAAITINAWNRIAITTHLPVA